jgi:hypothetical protein
MNITPVVSNGGIRRIFDNTQIIEKFGQWLLICGKAKLTRDSTLWPQSSLRNS